MSGIRLKASLQRAILRKSGLRASVFAALGERLGTSIVRTFAKKLIRGAPLFCAALLATVVAASSVSCATDPRSAELGGGDSTQGEGEASETVIITRVVDGDTVEISPTIDGIEDVRLIGIDTPEASGECAPEPLAGEAEDYTTRYESDRASLEFDEERIDRYGRLLAYVYVGKRDDDRSPENEDMLNDELVRRGLAQVATFPPNERYEGEFIDSQTRAREKSVGIWGLDPGQQELLADRGNGIGGGC